MTTSFQFDSTVFDEDSRNDEGDCAYDFPPLTGDASSPFGIEASAAPSSPPAAEEAALPPAESKKRKNTSGGLTASSKKVRFEEEMFSAGRPRPKSDAPPKIKASVPPAAPPVARPPQDAKPGIMKQTRVPGGIPPAKKPASEPVLRLRDPENAPPPAKFARKDAPASEATHPNLPRHAMSASPASHRAKSAKAAPPLRVPPPAKTVDDIEDASGDEDDDPAPAPVKASKSRSSAPRGTRRPSTARPRRRISDELLAFRLNKLETRVTRYTRLLDTAHVHLSAYVRERACRAKDTELDAADSTPCASECSDCESD